MDSVQAFGDAVEAFLASLADVSPGLLALALGLHLANMGLRAFAWLAILRAAYPEAGVTYRTALTAYAAGVGVNAVAPARGGDVVKVVGARTRIAGSSTPAIVATLIAETVFDAVVGIGLLTWAYGTDRLPGLPELPTTGLFELSFYARHQTALEVAIATLPLLVFVGWRYLEGHVRAFRERVGQGLAIMRSPVAYLRGVAAPQALGWCCRLGTAWAMLGAFGVEATPANAALVLVVGSISTLLPITPGGAGAQQALLALVLAGAAAQSTILAFSVGAQVATTATNAIVGIVAVTALFGRVRLRDVIEHARRHDAAG